MTNEEVIQYNNGVLIGLTAGIPINKRSNIQINFTAPGLLAMDYNNLYYRTSNAIFDPGVVKYSNSESPTRNYASYYNKIYFVRQLMEYDSSNQLWKRKYLSYYDTMLDQVINIGLIAEEIFETSNHSNYFNTIILSAGSSGVLAIPDSVDLSDDNFHFFKHDLSFEPSIPMISRNVARTLLLGSRSLSCFCRWDDQNLFMFREEPDPSRINFNSWRDPWPGSQDVANLQLRLPIQGPYCVIRWTGGANFLTLSTDNSLSTGARLGVVQTGYSYPDGYWHRAYITHYRPSNMIGLPTNSNKVLLIPGSALEEHWGKLVIFDVQTGELTVLFDQFEKVNRPFSSGTLLPDGRILLVPKRASNFYIFDPVNNSTIKGPSYGRDLSWGDAWDQGIVLDDGRIILVPWNTNVPFGILSSDIPESNPFYDGLILGMTMKSGLH